MTPEGFVYYGGSLYMTKNENEYSVASNVWIPGAEDIENLVKDALIYS